MKYFIDSSYIIALVNEKDSLHDKAIEYLELIKTNECYISNLIINEIITVIGNKIDLKTAIITYDLLNRIFNIIDEYESKDFNYKTMIIYETYNTKLSFTDSSIIEVMRKNNIMNLVSFDKEFKRVKDINLIS